MGAGILYRILVALVLFSFASGFRAERRTLLEPEKTSVTKGPTPSTGNNPPPSSPVSTSLKSPPLEKPPVPPPVPNSPSKFAPPPNNLSVSPPTPSQHHSKVASPAPIPVGPPPKPENKPISPDNGNSEANYVCPPSKNVTCHIKGLSACLRNDSQKLVLIIHNNGGIPLNLSFLHQELKIPDHSNRSVEVKKLSKEDQSIILKSGNETCAVPLGPPKSNPNSSMFHPDMDHVTPLHGIFVASFSILLIGGVWGCCKLRKRSLRSNSRVAYQQLEMSSEPPLGISTNEEREIGWDDHWNDGWDEEEARGRTSTANQKSSSDKNDWEDWDD